MPGTGIEPARPLGSAGVRLSEDLSRCSHVSSSSQKIRKLRSGCTPLASAGSHTRSTQRGQLVRLRSSEKCHLGHVMWCLVLGMAMTIVLVVQASSGHQNSMLQPAQTLSGRTRASTTMAF